MMDASVAKEALNGPQSPPSALPPVAEGGAPPSPQLADPFSRVLDAEDDPTSLPLSYSTIVTIKKLRKYS